MALSRWLYCEPIKALDETPLVAARRARSRSITDDGLPASPRTKAPRGWWIALPASRSRSPASSATCVGYLFWQRRRRLGKQRPGRLGLGHHQLRLVDRYRPRRHADLRHPLPVPAEVAHRDQPLRRGDDDLRGHLRRSSSRASTSAALWFAYYMFPLPEPDGALAELQEPAHLGPLRGLHVLHGLAALLVRRPHPRPRHAARPRR